MFRLSLGKVALLQISLFKFLDFHQPAVGMGRLGKEGYFRQFKFDVRQF